MKAFISANFNKRKLLNIELGTIISTLQNFNIEPFVFIDKYKFYNDQEHQMMKQAMKEIDSCDLLIAETSEKGIGIGVEVGYAKARDKPIIYVRKKEAEHSTTVSGISDFQIIYSNIDDLKLQLSDIIGKLCTHKI